MRYNAARMKVLWRIFVLLVIAFGVWVILNDGSVRTAGSASSRTPEQNHEAVYQTARVIVRVDACDKKFHNQMQYYEQSLSLIKGMTVDEWRSGFHYTDLLSSADDPELRCVMRIPARLDGDPIDLEWEANVPAGTLTPLTHGAKSVTTWLNTRTNSALEQDRTVQ